MKILTAVWLPFSFTGVSILLLKISAIFIVPAFLGTLDTIARYRDLKRLQRRRLHKMDLKLMASSRCQRNACIAAHPAAKEYYRKLGFKWYHLLPQGTFTIKANPYLTLKFYKDLIGLR